MSEDKVNPRDVVLGVNEGNIHQAINAIMAEVGYVQKTKTEKLNYSFAGEADLIAAIRPVMVKHGVYMSVVDISDVRIEQYETAKGTPMVNTSMIVKVAFYHAPSGSFITVTSRGEGADSGDKSSNKALTGAYKYALRQTFCIETGDDPDKEPSEERKSKSGDGKLPSDGKHAHNQKSLVALAQTEYKINPEEIGKILKAAGITEFDPSKWDEMVNALKNHTGEAFKF